MLQKRACDLTVEDRAHYLRQSDFGLCLNEDLLARLAAKSFAIDYRRGRFIYRPHDPADSLYVIARGRVKLCRIEETTAREAVIDILSAGSLFGESALYATEPKRDKCAVAYENSRLLRIPVGDFKE